MTKRKLCGLTPIIWEPFGVVECRRVEGHEGKCRCAIRVTGYRDKEKKFVIEWQPDPNWVPST